MTNYNKILAAVDFNEHSDAVIQSALIQARCSGATLVVLHVVNFTRLVDDDFILPPTGQMEENLLDSASKRLQEMLNRLEAKDAKPITIIGRPKQEILRVAQQEAINLIVIGAHGHHGILGLLGSTADRILHQAACHVLTVR